MPNNNSRFPVQDDFVDPLQNYDPPVYNSVLERVLSEESVDAILATPFITIDENESVVSAIRLLNESKVSCLAVTDGDQLLGIFTERDALERVSERFPRLAETPIRDVMTVDPTVVYEDDPAGTALAAVAVAGYRHIPVLAADGSIKGIISPKRIFDFLEQQNRSTTER